MRRTFWSMLFVMGIALSACPARSDDETKKPDATPPKAEGKAEEPKKEEGKKEEGKKDEPKKDDAKKDDAKKDQKKAEKKETVEQRMARRRRAIDESVLKENWDKVLANLDEIIDDKEIDADDHIEAAYYKFKVLAEERLDGPKACAVAKMLGELAKDDATVLNDVAWRILDTEGIKNPDFDVALKLAERAVEVDNSQSGEILDTLARAHFEKGNLEKAVEFQAKAVDRIMEDFDARYNTREELKATLEKYKTALAEKNAKKDGKKEGQKEEKKEEKKAEPKTAEV